MASLNDFPVLRKAFDELQEQKTVILAKSAPLRKERDAIQAKIQPFEDRMRELNGKIKEIEQPDLAGIDNQISAIARAAGGKFLSDGAGKGGEPPIEQPSTDQPPE